MVHHRDQLIKMETHLSKLLFLLLLLISFSSCGNGLKPNETRVALYKGGNITPYESECPKLSLYEHWARRPCKVFEEMSICSSSQLHSVSSTLKNLETYGEAAKDCLNLFELLICSICQKPTCVCSKFCDRVFESCSNAYFSRDSSGQLIVPCGGSKEIICGKLSEWVSNGTEFCYAMGYTVTKPNDSIEKPVVESLIKTETFGWFQDLQKLVTFIKTETFGWFQDLQKLVREMTLVQQISWVLTLLYLGRKLYNRWRQHQEIEAMIQRDARRLNRMHYMNGNA